MTYTATSKEVLVSVYSSSQKTASGQRFDPNALTTAHRHFAFGTRLLIEYKGRSVIVTVNDRGPYIRSRELDLSMMAAKQLGCSGVCRVSMTVLS